MLGLLGDLLKVHIWEAEIVDFMTSEIFAKEAVRSGQLRMKLYEKITRNGRRNV